MPIEVHYCFTHGDIILGDCPGFCTEEPVRACDCSLIAIAEFCDNKFIFELELGVGNSLKDFFEEQNDGYTMEYLLVHLEDFHNNSN